MGIVYTLSVNGFKKMNEEGTGVSLGNLKEYLMSLKPKKSAKILCLDDCSSCDIFLDEAKVATLDDFIDNSIRVYRYDYFTGIQESMKEVYFNEDDIQEDVCFSYSVNHRGVGDQVLVEFKTRVYDYTSYFEPTRSYASVAQMIDEKEKLIEEVKR